MKIAFDPETLAPVIEKADDVDSLELSQRGILSGFGGMRFGNIPVGDALLGGASATLVSELITGFVGSGVMGALVKLVAGNMLAGAFSGVMGRGATDSARLFITYDAIRDLIPIDTWTAQIFSGVRNTVNTGQDSQGTPTTGVNTGNGSVIAIDQWLRNAG
jgi:hypothetical protein